MSNNPIQKIELDPPTEIYTKKILAGNIEDVRQRLVGAIEQLGYNVIEDEPKIIARRGSKGWATWSMSADVLDVATDLTIFLKPVGENSTRATFEYLVKSPIMTKGQKEIVLQEAKTIAAISKKQPIEKLCSVCETESTGDSKFCRGCGAPLTGEQSELEVLRIMAETRAGKALITSSSVAMIVSLAIFILTFIFTDAIKPKLIPILFIVGGLGFLFSTFSSFFGLNRLKRALDKPDTQAQNIQINIPEQIEIREHEALPPQQTKPASVTEGTTNLLDKDWANEREKEKVAVSKVNTTRDLE